ncbi:D-Ala-D-Ala carboxypeptidase family metallohydrolase [Ramlibacter sp.]|uniref:D-Ala-D-Ala carboxypeptidase family metallohydrolase n=1 Tax=Ramlibacter sp. TaxID=1917967 RepID=UPI0018076B30|nr:D-Ala-D-Ala carboxypeptidase family metallohydrolase [Ramlibacter sp.]MBA2676311.1 peptidase M15 [Ramlibacter sp.]
MMRTLALLLLLAALPAAAAPEEDDAALFDAWVKTHSVADFEEDLAKSELNGVVPTRQLLRTATDWKKCGAERFEIPPRAQWADVKKVLKLVAELKKRKVLEDFEGASGYRNPALNRCAAGAPKSSHTISFALDIVPKGAGGADEQRLCEFWRKEGQAWNMGLSKYPSGRIHLDVSGWRSWGADHTRATSFCAVRR